MEWSGGMQVLSTVKIGQHKRTSFTLTNTGLDFHTNLVRSLQVLNGIGIGSGGQWQTEGTEIGFNGKQNQHKEVIMAKFLSNIFSEVRGSIGGVTFSMNKGVMTAKAKASPVRRMRTTQPSNRAILGYLSRQYSQLSAVNRGLWETWASNHPQTNSLGQSIILSGLQAYVMLNHVARRIGGVGEGKRQSASY